MGTNKKISRASAFAAALLLSAMGASAAVMDDAIIKYCNEKPDDPQCAKLASDLDGLCRVDPFLSSCKGLCPSKPDHPACRLRMAELDLDGLCRKNPFLPACKGLCAEDPNHPACKLHMVKKNDGEGEQEKPKPPRVELADFNSLKGFQAAFTGDGSAGVTASLGGNAVPAIVHSGEAGSSDADSGELEFGGPPDGQPLTGPKKKPSMFAVLVPEP